MAFDMVTAEKVACEVDEVSRSLRDLIRRLSEARWDYSREPIFDDERGWRFPSESEYSESYAISFVEECVTDEELPEEIVTRVENCKTSDDVLWELDQAYSDRLRMVVEREKIIKQANSLAAKLKPATDSTGIRVAI